MLLTGPDNTIQFDAIIDYVLYHKQETGFYN